MPLNNEAATAAAI